MIAQIEGIVVDSKNNFVNNSEWQERFFATLLWASHLISSHRDRYSKWKRQNEEEESIFNTRVYWIGWSFLFAFEWWSSMSGRRDIRNRDEFMKTINLSIFCLREDVTKRGVWSIDDDDDDDGILRGGNFYEILKVWNLKER
jgi:hypothetical protein